MRLEVIQTVCTVTEAAEHGCIDVSALEPGTLAKYIQTRDLSLLKFRSDKPKIVFHVSEIANDHWPWVVGGASDEEKMERAFRAAVTKVENCIQLDDVRVGDWTPTFDGRNRKIMSDEDAYKFSPAERLEIGGVAWAHSFFPRRINGCFRLLPMLVAALERTIYLPADASPTDAAETSSAKPSPRLDSSPSKGGTDSASETAGASSVSATDAIAAGTA